MRTYGWAALSLVFVALIGLGLSDPTGRGDFLIGLVAATLSWPVAVILVSVLLRPELSRALIALAQRPLSVTVPGAAIAIGGSVEPSQGDVPASEEIAEIGADIGTPLDATDAERAAAFQTQAKLWHFAYLGQVLRPQTIAVLRWLQTRGAVRRSTLARVGTFHPRHQRTERDHSGLG